jgi:hypothetical protein
MIPPEHQHEIVHHALHGERFNPRYAAYAKAHGRTPEEQLEIDRQGSMLGFSEWIMGKWDEWTRERLKESPKPDGWTAIEWQRYLASWHDGEFDKWLEGQ